MNSVDKFKQSLKNFKSQLQKVQDDLRDEKGNVKKEIDEQVITKVALNTRLLENKLGVDSLTDFALESTANLGKEIDDELASYDVRIRNINRVIRIINLLLNDYVENKANRYVPLYRLMEILFYAHFHDGIPLEDIAVIIGITVKADVKHLEKSKDNKASDENSLFILNDFFNDDGTFKYNDRIDIFNREIKYLENSQELFRPLLKSVAGIDYERKSIAKDLTKLLIKSNEEILDESEITSALMVKLSINEMELVLERYKQDDDVEEDNVWYIVSAAFDHEKAIKPLDIVPFLHVMSLCKIITPVPDQAIAECLGMLVHKNFENIQNSRFYTENHPKEIRQLIEYFNSDGSFKENPRVKDFRDILYKLVANDFKENELNSGHIPDAMDMLISSLTELLQESNELYRQEHNRQKREKKENRARQELERYYKDGCVIEIPFNLCEFYALLDECGYEEDERLIIEKRVDNRVQMMGNRVGTILDDDELQIYIDARDLASSAIISNDEHKEAIKALANLSSIADLLSLAIDEDEKEYLSDEKEAIMECLKRFISQYSDDEVEFEGVNPVGKAQEGTSSYVKPFSLAPIK